MFLKERHFFQPEITLYWAGCCLHSRADLKVTRQKFQMKQINSVNNLVSLTIGEKKTENMFFPRIKFWSF